MITSMVFGLVWFPTILGIETSWCTYFVWIQCHENETKMTNPQFVMKIQRAYMWSSHLITQVGLKWLVLIGCWVMGELFLGLNAWLHEWKSDLHQEFLNFEAWILDYAFGKWANAFLYAHPICALFILYQELLEAQVWNIQARGSNCVKNYFHMWGGLTDALMQLILSHWLLFLVVQVMEAMRKVFKKQYNLRGGLE